MTNDFAYFDTILSELPTITPDTIVSRTLVNSDQLRVVLFGFAPGQELSEHTSSHPAILHFLQGEAQLSLGETIRNATADTFVFMPPQLPHRILAKTSLVMLLIMAKAP